MSAEEIVDASPVLRAYYSILTGGVDRYGEGLELIPFLGAGFVFEGPIAGTVSGAERFARGVRGFIEAVRKIDMIQAVVTAHSAAVLYDAVLPGGTVRFAEFFELDGGEIKSLRIHYNATEYLAAGGR
ncbi:hypothetical protein [Sinomonas sp. ASV322]|uniref:hypothetical protein n=1 Tax=Sinomonas sp. ASV322 TaxID=3041920 RepID=UPI0027DEA2E0|nr:hypothetical protein [Sinomonas sp. ASV322]MDQ4502532.1 hypothetical protein [Sinomonas sp. ASV322]